MSTTLVGVQESLDRYFTAVEGMTQSTRRSMETEVIVPFRWRNVSNTSISNRD
jgi:hypothetical protein